VALFDMTACPEGWSALPEAQGRVLVGLPGGGTLLGSVGDALGDLEDRTHLHVVAGRELTTSAVPLHGHTVDPPAVQTGVFTGVTAPVIGIFDSERYELTSSGHSHTINGPLISSGASGFPDHTVAIPDRSMSATRTRDVMPYVQLLACRNDSATAPTVPVGATVFFTLPSCPVGWSELTAARGRAIVGQRSGGTAGGTVGGALTDLEDRVHGHTVVPVSVSTSTAPDHVHQIDLPLIRSSRVDSTLIRIGASINEPRFTLDADVHDHTVDVAVFNSGAAGAHAHQVTIPEGQTGTIGTGAVVPYVQLLACRSDALTTATAPAGTAMLFAIAGCPSGWSELAAARGRAVVGLGAGGTVAGTVGAPLRDLENRAHAHSTRSVTVDTSAVPGHIHSIDPPATVTSYFVGGQPRVQLATDRNASILGMAQHRHTVDIQLFGSGAAGAHAHQVTVPVMETTLADAGQVMPYVQLLACAKG
jgi:hypothetical protein